MDPLRALFDETWYRATYFPEGQLPSGYREGYHHYLAEGAAMGFSPGRHFDETWYRSTHADASRAIAEGRYASGYHHYVSEGAGQGYAPNRYFLPRWYLAWYTDAGAAVERGEYAHAHEHYLREGIGLQLSPNPFFDERWYRQTYPDVDAAVRDGRIESGHQHFIERGVDEGRQGSTIFDGPWYVDRYPDVKKDIESGLARHGYDHFCRYGMVAGKSPCADFDERWYRMEYPEVGAGVAQGRWSSGLDHFVAEGMMHGYAPRPDGGAGALGYNDSSGCARHELCEFLHGNAMLRVGGSAAPLVSIVLVLYNRAALSLRCLRSIAAWVSVPHEVIAIDNHSQDQTAELLARVRGVWTIQNDCNQHFLRAANQGAAAATGKYLLFLNNDCELQAGAVRAAVEILETGPDAGAVGGKLIQPDGRLLEAGSYLRPNAFSAQFGRGQDAFHSEFMHRRDVPYCSGAFLLTPRRLFEEAGGFDPAFEPAYCEDVDYCLRLWQRGWRVIFNPESIVVHTECASVSYRRFLHIQALRSTAVLHKRYREYFETVPDYGIAPVSSRDGKRWRSACLLIVGKVSAEKPAWAEVLGRLLAEKRFVTIYPLRAWRGDREDAGAWLPAAVELVSGRGSDELGAFCRQREPVYQDVLLLGDPAGFDAPSFRQWLPGARLLIDDLETVTANQL